MLNFHKLHNNDEKSEAYNLLRNLVKKDFQSAEIQKYEDGYCVVWLGLAISEKSKTTYDAWLDVSLPY